MRRTRLLCLALAAVTLAGCGGVREQFGLDKQSPDEFRVVSRAPLTVPPEFALRPPRPGAARPQVGTPTDQARRTVFRLGDQQPSVREVMPDDGRSLGERAILVEAGADEAEPDIRQVVDRETQRVNEGKPGFPGGADLLARRPSRAATSSTPRPRRGRPAREPRPGRAGDRRRRPDHRAARARRLRGDLLERFATVQTRVSASGGRRSLSSRLSEQAVIAWPRAGGPAGAGQRSEALRRPAGGPLNSGPGRGP